MTEHMAARGPRKTWTFGSRRNRRVGLVTTISYGDGGRHRWGACIRGRGTAGYRTPWGAYLGARRWYRQDAR